MKRYNVLWLMSDQHNPNCMGISGNTVVKTPNLDSIGEEGVNFVNAFANNPICSPSRICFMNGQHVHTHGYYGNQNTDVKAENSIFLPTIFRKYGYQTALYGKAHLVRKWLDEGFEDYALTDLIDSYEGNPESCHYFKYLKDLGLADYYEEGSPKLGQNYTMNGSAPAQLPFVHSIEKFTGDKTIEFLENRDTDRPFFLNMSFQRPHAPITPAKEHFDRYSPDEVVLPESKVDYFTNKFASKPAFMGEKLSTHGGYPYASKDEEELKRIIASYYALITAIDEQIGRVIEKLKEMGEYENTIIFYTADHGDFAGEHGLFHKNFGIYDSIQKIPFLLKYPDGKKNAVCGELVESIDWYPTICELCHIPVPEEVEGESVIGILERGQSGKDEVFCDWKYGKDNVIAVRTKDKRLVRYTNSKDGELYDHCIDKGEINNLYHDANYQSLRLDLTEKLLDFKSTHKVETGMKEDKVYIDRHQYDPIVLLQKRKIYWSDLEKAYTELRQWPPKKVE